MDVVCVHRRDAAVFNRYVMIFFNRKRSLEIPFVLFTCNCRFSFLSRVRGVPKSRPIYYDTTASLYSPHHHIS